MIREQAIEIPLQPLNEQATTSGGPPGRLRTCHNVIVKKMLGGRVRAQKRPGFQPLATATRQNGTSITAGANAHLLTTYRDQLIKVCGTAPSVYSEADATWEQPTGIFATPAVVALPTILRRPLYNNNTIVSMPGCAAVGNVLCQVFYDAASLALIQFTDNKGVIIKAPFSPTSTAFVKVVSDGTRFWVFSQGTTQTVTNIQTFDTNGNVTATSSINWGVARALWDIGYNSGTGKVWNATSAGANTQVTVFTWTGGVISNSSAALVIDSTQGVFRIENTKGGTNLYFGVSNTAGDVKAYEVTSGIAINNTYAIATAVGFVGAGTGYVSNVSFDIVVAVSVLPDNAGTPGAAVNNQTLVYSSTHAGVSQLLITQRSIALCSRAFVDQDGTWRLVAYYQSGVLYTATGAKSLASAQPSYFVLDITATTPVVCGQFELGDAGAFTATSRNATNFLRGYIADVATDSSGVGHVVLQYLATQTAAQVTAFGSSQPGFTALVGLYEYTFSSLNKPAGATPTEPGLLLGGMQGTIYDGTQFVECGIHLAPEVTAFTLSNAAGSLTQNVTYTFCFVYEWIDGDGNVYQSVPSTPLPVAMGANTEVTFTLTNLRTSAKARPRISVYRNFDPALLGGTPGTTLRKVGEVTSNAISDTSSFTDTASDTLCSLGQNMYNQPLTPASPGSLDYYPAPAHSRGCTAEGRVFVIGFDKAIWFSFQVAETQGLAFNPLFRVVLPTQATPLSIQPMDGRVSILCDDGTSWTFLTGNLPNATASTGAVPTPEQLPFTTGTTGPSALIPGGVLYTSERGPMLMDRAFASHYIGAGVDGEIGPPASAATGISIDVDRQQRAYFMLGTSNGTPGTDTRALVYDLLLSMWYTWTLPQSPIAGTVWKGQYTFVDSQAASTVWVLDPDTSTTFTDNGAAIPQTVELASIAFSGVNGYECVWQAQWFGTYQGPHNMNVGVKFDQGTAGTSETHAIDVFTPPSLYRYEAQLATIDVQAVGLVFTDSFNHPLLASITGSSGGGPYTLTVPSPGLLVVGGTYVTSPDGVNLDTGSFTITSIVSTTVTVTANSGWTPANHGIYANTTSLQPGDSFTLESVGFLVGQETGLGRLPIVQRAS